MIMKKAFTLIELLVVIAIIAILAAILFPVFAQAKVAAKKTQAISNIKQMGTAANIYMADYDDFMPLAFGFREDGSAMFNVSHPYPANALNDAVWSTEFRRQQAGVMWANSIQPYTKNLQLTEGPTANTGTNPGEVFNPNVRAGRSNLAYNGFMHALSSSEVTNPSSAILMWSGFGNGQANARAASSPGLNCGGPGVPALTCRFNAAAHPNGQAGNADAWIGIVGGAYTSVWTFERQAVYVRTDSSARVMRTGGTTGDVNVPPPAPTIQSALADPFAKISEGGRTNLGAWLTRCTSGTGTPGYWCYFRPDREQ